MATYTEKLSELKESLEDAKTVLEKAKVGVSVDDDGKFPKQRMYAKENLDKPLEERFKKPGLKPGEEPEPEPKTPRMKSLDELTPPKSVQRRVYGKKQAKNAEELKGSVNKAEEVKPVKPIIPTKATTWKDTAKDVKEQKHPVPPVPKNKLIKSLEDAGFRQSALLLKNWDEYDATAKEFLKK